MSAQQIGELVQPPPLSVPPPAGSAQLATSVGTRLMRNVESVVRGRGAAVEIVVCAVLAAGHVLLEDLPGSGKTTLAKAVARSLGGQFRRIQGTADLLPSDVTGSAVWRPDRHAFEFVAGPVFGNVVLVDELNRTPPRTQSAFLEAMDEGAVTADGTRYELPQPFVVLATQNPLEHHGTFALPDAQLDRFTVALALGRSDPLTERQIVREQLTGPSVERLGPVVSSDELLAARRETASLHVHDAVLDYAVRLAAGTRAHPEIATGVSTRGVLALVRCAQARAALYGRAHVLPDDVRALAVPALAHRLVLQGMPDAERTRALVAGVVSGTPVPTSA